MTAGRVPRMGPAEARAAAEDAGIPEFMADLSVFQVLLHHPRLARAVNDLLAVMLWEGRLDARLRELAIMRIGWLTACRYEWTQHWRVALGLGVAEEDLLGVRDWPSHAPFGPVERAVLAATDELVAKGALSARTWRACEAELGGDAAVMLELVAALGTWRMIASLLETLEVPLEDGVVEWPPDGRRPPNHGPARRDAAS
ncbi:MAG: carboxymuconolactone decarboxylase family protein [Acidimicrobiales bacterium]